MVTTRSATHGPSSRPVSIPRDFGPGSIAKVQGVVTLENSLWWSGGELTLDTRVELQRRRLYEIVLTEGVEEDVRNYISYKTLASSIEQLFLPVHVRDAWRAWLNQFELCDWS